MQEKDLQQWVASVDRKLDNHIAHIIPEITKVQTNQEWLMKFFWIIATTSVGGLVTGILNLL